MNDIDSLLPKLETVWVDDMGRRWSIWEMTEVWSFSKQTYTYMIYVKSNFMGQMEVKSWDLESFYRTHALLEGNTEEEYSFDVHKPLSPTQCAHIRAKLSELYEA